MHRVWARGQDFPGLAMSRSLGDKLAHTVGVIGDPGKSIYFKSFRCIFCKDR